MAGRRLRHYTATMTPFLAVQPTLENHFRALILFGRNVATYKFALGKALLELSGRPDDLVRMDELAEPFARHLCTHLSSAPRQATSRTSGYLDVCRRANAGEVSADALRAATVTRGFNNVIDAFHRLGATDIPHRFFVDERATNGGIRLTDALRILVEQAAPAELEGETEARWRLVETAWELGVADTLIEYDAEAEQLIARPHNHRVAVTSSRAALNGYQKGHCFYCFAPISISAGPLAADVDHVFPWSLRHILGGNVNGVWNLVLACRDCNRGSSGKHDCVPALDLVERLHRRNEFLITSHHPLRETLMAQTGASATGRIAFLQRNHTAALTARIVQWHASSRAAASF